MNFLKHTKKTKPCPQLSRPDAMALNTAIGAIETLAARAGYKVEITFKQTK
jgi:hypothetical protein